MSSPRCPRRVGDLQARARIGGATRSATSGACTTSTEIHLRVIPPERKLDYLRRGELDMIAENTARTGTRTTRFPRSPTDGCSGRASSWTCRGRLRPPDESRGADLPEQGFPQCDAVPVQLRAVESEPHVQRVFSRSLLLRRNRSFANPNLKARTLRSAKAREYLERAGYRRPGRHHEPDTVRAMCATSPTACCSRAPTPTTSS